MRRPGSASSVTAPQRLEDAAHGVVGDVAIAGQLVREGAHVAGALDVVLAAQRVHADALAAEIAGHHREVGDRHHGRGALAVLGDAEAVVDRAVAAGGIEPGRAADRLGRHAGQQADRLRAVLRPRHELGPILEGIAVAELAHEGFVGQALGDDRVRQRIQDRGVGAGPERQVIVGLDMGGAHQVDAARIDHDQLRALAQALLHARGEDRMGVGRIGADHQDDISLLDRVEILRAGRGAERLAQAEAGRRMADAGAGIDVVVAEAAADQLLDEIGLLVGAARRGDAADRQPAVLGLQALELGRDPVDRDLPAHLAPGLVDRLADHRLQDALLVVSVAPGEAALDAGMAAIGLAVLVGDHAHQLLAAHLGLEAAADAAIGAGRDHRMLGLADLDQALLRQGRGRAGLHAGAARHAFGAEEIVGERAGRDLGVEAAALDGQREGALHFLAGAHAARADDAFRRIEGEVRVASRPSPAWCGSRRRSRSAPRAGRPRPPCPAARSRRWRRRSGSRADGRRCRAPSRPCGSASAARSGSTRPCPARPAWCRRRACRRGRRSRPGRGGRSRRPRRNRWRRAWAPGCRHRSPRA